jgi:hypothetical protein
MSPALEGMPNAKLVRCKSAGDDALRPGEAKQRQTRTTPATAADPVALADKAPLRHHPHNHADVAIHAADL